MIEILQKEDEIIRNENKDKKSVIIELIGELAQLFMNFRNKIQIHIFTYVFVERFNKIK